LLEALGKELELRKNEAKGEVIETIYFGGGTPSILSYDELVAIFEIIQQNYIISKNAEITLEANPDDLSEAFLKDIKKLGFNRLSIGVQSFFDTDLQFMNRAHTAKESYVSIQKAKKIGFNNISIDLIYGVPNLSNINWKKNLDLFLELEIPHLSSYALTVEPRTVLAHKIKTQTIKPLNDFLAKTHFEILIKTMDQNSIRQYELSNFAIQGFESQHNTSYWKGRKYIGIGPSAHSYNQVSRSWNVSNNAKYIKSLEAGKLPSQSELLSVTMQYNEYIMTGLRTIWGIDLTKIKHTFGDKYYVYCLQQIKKYIEKKQILYIDTNRVVVSKNSLFIVDGIISDLFWID